MENIAIIAGEGALPAAIAKKLNDEGRPPLIITLRDDADKLRPLAGKLVQFSAPALGKVVREAKNFGASAIIMAGRVPKRIIYSPKFFLTALFDPLTRAVAGRCLRDDHSLLGGVVSVLEASGLRVIPYWQILPEFLASDGALSARKPTPEELKDIECGRGILRVTLPCSFGQAVAVADGAVVAVEAMEGTDAMIGRAGKLAGRGVVVKMMRTDQDLRYDLPTVGPATIESMKSAGLTCLAVEAGRTLIIDPDETLSMADKYKIAVWGVTA